MRGKPRIRRDITFTTTNMGGVMMQNNPYTMLAGLACALACAASAQAATTNRYVVKGNTGAAYPYHTWDNAAADIQTAIDVASAANGDAVIVAPGVYDQGGRPFTGLALTNRVVIDKTITVRSRDNEPSTAIIMGAWDVNTNGPVAVRPVYMVAGATLIGFTVTNGATLTSGHQNDLVGGGVFAPTTGAVISNCVVAGNAAIGDTAVYQRAGGGVFRGTLYDCVVSGNTTGYRGGGTADSIVHDSLLAMNTALDGGGAYRGTLYRTVVSNNLATAAGGGTRFTRLYDSAILDNVANAGGGAANLTYHRCVFAGNKAVAGNGGGVLSATVYDSVISNNTASVFGGGARESTVYDSLIILNTAPNGGGATFGDYYRCIFAGNHATFSSGGGAYLGNYYNCLFYGNRSGWVGGGGHSGSYYSCTVVGNYAASRGGGLHTAAAVVNCIIYGNDVGNEKPNVHNVAAQDITYSLTWPAVEGWDDSNIAGNPKFVDPGSGFGLTHVMGNYRLAGGSPALNTGVVQGWMADAVDLDGNPRIDNVTGQVDMGAYEAVYRGSILLVR